MGARETVDYSTKTVAELCELWDLAQRTQSERLTTELLEEFVSRAERPAPRVVQYAAWITWILRLFRHSTRRVGGGVGEFRDSQI